MAVRRLPRAPAPPDPALLAERLERAEAEQLARTGAPGPAGALAIAGGLAVSKGPRSSSSAAFGLGLRGPVTAEDLDRVEAHLGALGGEVRIELCAHADPSLAAELARRGYRVERFLQVLARGVAAQPAVAAADRVGRVVVREILPGEERAFADAFAIAHLGAAPGPDEAAEDLLAVPRTEGNACFAGFEGTSVVAIALVSEHAGVAALSGAGVLPAWRGQGLHLALVHARLAWARARACDVAASAVEPGGASQRTLERAGFRVAYPKTVMVLGE
ncbi:MAG TPA: GNAT family N-acetyltransferase [Anaeromyxobacter sp.]